MSLQTLITRMCPYVSDPDRDCYCTKDGSQEINNAVKYCSNNFETCSIYKAKMSGFEELITDN